MDRIKIVNLEIYARHGVYPEEKVLGQKFIVSAVLYLDTRKAGMCDSLDDTVNYGTVSYFIRDFMEKNTYKLIEAAAEHLAAALLRTYPQVQQIDLELKKPWAPIGLPLETVCVEITRSWHRAYLALGSNLGDRKAFLDAGVKGLAEREDCRVEQVSTYRETPPWGEPGQENFLNGALELSTLLPPEELLDCLQELEAAAGRTRTRHWGPRTLDLDILLYDDAVIDTPRLHIPHPWLSRRKFMLEPLAELAPWMRDPLCHRTVEEMLQDLK